MDQKGHMIDQKGLKMYEKSQKMEFLDLKYLLFSRIFQSRYPPPPLNGKSSCPKTLSGNGGYPHPLTEKIRLLVLDAFPNRVHGQENINAKQEHLMKV